MIGARLGPVVIDPMRVAAFVRTPSGVIVRDLMRRGTNVQLGARRNVRKRTRALERSIVKRLDVDARGPVVWVGTDSPIALFEHDGTRAHIIRARRRKVLRFPAGGRVVFAREVRHPGTQGSKFLIKALPLARD